tara:strand:- start:579 stop:878 length:300 start_codon:yes stop_codon:yes gene_type:complete
MSTLIESITHITPINLEYSSGSISQGKHGWTMDLYFNDDNTGFIEWDIPSLDRTENIGLWFEIDKDGKRTLSDYDGVFSLPSEAIELLHKHGIDPSCAV